MDTQHPSTIILVEDDAGHAVLIEKNLRRAGIGNQIIVLDNGRKALDFLFQAGDYSGNHLPVHPLILLDLNLPVLDGFQVLRAIKNHDRTRHIPVIVVTTTDLPHEIALCYELGCNIYVTKPVEYDAFCDTIRKLGLFLPVVKVSAS
jgi:CheY-like chemotaxis protein